MQKSFLLSPQLLPQRGMGSCLPTLTMLGHDCLRALVRPGDIVIDATAGNGHDTLLLSALSGAEGCVYAFDVQQAALDAVQARLTAAQELPWALQTLHLYCTGHENMREVLKSGHDGAVRAVVFNLGYLPGSDKRITTRTETTLQALDAACAVLAVPGLLSIHIYTGHPSGQEEGAAVLDWAQRLDWGAWRVLCHSLPNQTRNREYLLLMEKRL